MITGYENAKEEAIKIVESAAKLDEQYAEFQATMETVDGRDEEFYKSRDRWSYRETLASILRIVKATDLGIDPNHFGGMLLFSSVGYISFQRDIVVINGARQLAGREADYARGVINRIYEKCKPLVV